MVLEEPFPKSQVNVVHAGLLIEKVASILLVVKLKAVTVLGITARLVVFRQPSLAP